MSWKYSTSTYPSRDNSATREPPQSKYGFLNSKFGSSTLDRRSGWSSSVSGDSKFNRNHTDSVEHVPVWGKASSVSDNLASVQRLKERYNPNEETPKDKKSENKDLPSHKSAKFYGRSYTSLQVDNRATDDNSSFSKFRRKLEKPAEPAEKNSFVSRFGSSFRSLDPPKSLYIPSETSKLPTRKYSSDLSPSTVHAFLGDKYTRSDKIESPDEKITVVTRGTSPTPTASAVYLRSKRTDYGIEKRVSRPRKRPDMVHKEVQTDREDFSFSKYAIYSDSNIRTKPWSSYVDKYSSVNSYSPKFSTRTSYSTEGKRDHFSTLGVSNLNECKRSTSREESDDPTTPDSLHKSPTGKPPLIKEAEKKFYVRKSPPSSFRLPLKFDNAKSELIKSPVSPNHPSSPLQCKITSPEVPKTVYKPGGVQSPKVTIDRCPDLMQAIADVSSASESSEEESSSEDEAENPSSGGITIKKSITNFLQNIPNSPNTPTQSQTRSNLYQKINFKRIESGEKAWWMESTDKVVDGVTKAPSNRSIPTQSPENQMPKSSVANNFLSPTHVPSRHVANNKDWSWSGSHKGGGDTSKLECHTSHEEKLDGKEEFNGVHCGIELAKVDRTSPYLSTHSPVNNFPVENGKWWVRGEKVNPFVGFIWHPYSSFVLTTQTIQYQLLDTYTISAKLVDSCRTLS